MDTQNNTDISLSISVKDLLEAGAHFGHQRQRWNPKMRRFIFEERGGLHIIDLAKTLQQIREAVAVVQDVVKNHRSILFVGTKKQAKETVKEVAEECGEFFVAERWLGGMLTNLGTVMQSVKKLDKIEKQIETQADAITKKELVQLSKQQVKLDKNLCGVRSMRKTPGLLIVVDPNKEHIAVKEARKLGIPVMALIDTNCDPDPIDHVIACNDDALKSIKLILDTLAQAVIEQKKRMKIKFGKEQAPAKEEAEVLKEQEKTVSVSE